MQPSILAGALALSLSVAPVALAAEAPAVAPAAASDAAKAGPSDKAQIAALEKRFTAAFNAKDLGNIMAVYARNGLFVYDATPPREYVGWEAYKKDWEGLLVGFPGPIKFSISDLAITTDGNMAYSHSTQAIDAPGNAIPKLVVRVTDVYRKTGGRWQIVHEHVSVPVDLATGKGDLLSKP
jgi:ketosteroid isomerase-like protein